MKVFTHKLDLDAALSLAAAREFIPEAQEAELVFVPADWDRELEEGDLDVRSSGRDIKGEERPDGTVGSCFAWIVARYAPEADQEALRSLVDHVDAHARGHAVEWLAPEPEESARRVLADADPNAFLRGLQAKHPDNDALVAERMAEYFSDMLEADRARRRAVIEADRAELIGGRRVAIVRDATEPATRAVLYERGVKVIVFVDGHDLGVIRKHGVSVRLDDPDMCAVVEDAGEKIGDGDGKWFVHDAGAGLFWGTRSVPATKPSRVPPERLAVAAALLLGAGTGPCWNCDWPNGGSEYCRHCGANLLGPQTWGNAEY